MGLILFLNIICSIRVRRSVHGAERSPGCGRALPPSERPPPESIVNELVV